MKKNGFLKLEERTKIYQLNNKEMESCHKCFLQKDTLYRVRISEYKVWVFVCLECMNIVKPDNPYYQYGGTWKNWKKK